MTAENGPGVTNNNMCLYISDAGSKVVPLFVPLMFISKVEETLDCLLCWHFF